MREPELGTHEECASGLTPILGEGLMSQIQSNNYVYNTLTLEELKNTIDQMDITINATPNQMLYYGESTVVWEELVFKKKSLSYEEILMIETDNNIFNE